MFLRSFFGKSKEESLTLGKLSEIIGAELPRAVDGSALCRTVLTQPEYAAPGDVVISAGWYDHRRVVSQSLEKGAIAVFCPAGKKPRCFRMTTASSPLKTHLNASKDTSCGAKTAARQSVSQFPAASAKQRQPVL